MHFCLSLLCIGIACLFLCFKLALTSLGSEIRDILEVLAVQLWTEPMKRNAFQKQRLKPRTYLFINLVHSFIAPPPSHLFFYFFLLLLLLLFFKFLFSFCCIMVKRYCA